MAPFKVMKTERIKYRYSGNERVLLIDSSGGTMWKMSETVGPVIIKDSRIACSYPE